MADIILVLPYPVDGPGIYRITDSKSGAFYIGSSANVRNRWYQHQCQLKRRQHGNPRMQNIWSVDPTRLSIETLHHVSEATKAALLALEQRELDAAGVGTNDLCMNVALVAGSHLGIKRSEATRRKMAEAQRGKKTSDEVKAKQRAAKLGKPLSEEHRHALSTVMRGRKINRSKGMARTSQRALSRDQVLALRAARSAGASWRLLGLQFNINQSAAKRCALGQTYADVTT